MHPPPRRVLLVSLLATALSLLIALAGAGPGHVPAAAVGFVGTLALTVTEGACSTSPGLGTLCLNQTLPAGTGVITGLKEWVYLNNGSTLYYLPLKATGVSATTVTVTVANSSTNALAGVSTLVWRQQTSQLKVSGNPTAPAASAANTGAANKTTSFYYAVSSASVFNAYLSYAWTNYTRFQFSASALNNAINVTLRYTYSLVTGARTWLNSSHDMTAPTVVAYSVMIGLGANFSVPASAANTTCGLLTDCTTFTYKFTSYTVASMYDTSNVVPAYGASVVPALVKGAGIFVTTFNVSSPSGTPGYGWVNFTVAYSNTTTQNTLGGFFTGATNTWQTVFVDFWYLWLILVVVILTALVVSMRGRKDKRRED